MSQKIAKLLGLWALCCLLACLLAGTARAATEIYKGVFQQSETDPKRPLYEPDRAQFMDGYSSSPEIQPISRTETTTAEWGHVFFQSYRDGNWEIYRYDMSSQVSTRLTNSANIREIQPRINQNATRLVYASNRIDNNYDVYTMNVDGSGTQRLTDSTADEFYAMWSPDGARIVYQSASYGQEEIFTMNADGSAQTRLTFDPAYDGQPSWSPDGSRIAFISNRTGGYRIYAMNTDGSGLVQLSLQSYSAHPVWSPDGQYILYDADGDGDGWQELWLMRSDGGDQHQVLAPSTSQVDLYASGWRQGGRDVLYTSVAWIEYQGQWYWTQSSISSHAITPYGGYVSFINSGEDWNPDWYSFDRQIPETILPPLPMESIHQFWYFWTVSDSGGSGPQKYFAQMREDLTGDWNDVIYTDNSPFLWFQSGIGGHTYYFRFASLDQAGNLEPWPADYEIFTTIEAHPPRTSVQALPEYWRGALTIQWGGDDPGASGIKSYDVQWRDGTGPWMDWLNETSLTSATFVGTLGHTYSFRSRARDNAQNLESWPAQADAITTLYRWKAMGRVVDNTGVSLPGVQANVTPAGFAALPSDWNGHFYSYAGSANHYSVELFKNGYLSLPPEEFPVTQDGFVEAILPPANNLIENWGFENGGFGSGDWFYTGSDLPPTITGTFRKSGDYAAIVGSFPEFSAQQNISNTSDPSNQSQAVIDDNNVIHVTWVEDGNPKYILYSHKAPGQQWSAPHNVASFTYSSPSLQLEIDNQGVLHIIWTEYYDTYYAQRGIDGVWSPPLVVPGISGDIKMAVENNGIVHLISNGNAQSSGLYYIQRQLNGTWTIPEKFYDETWFTPSVKVDSRGMVHSVWYHNNGSVWVGGYAVRGLNGNWSVFPELFGDPTMNVLSQPVMTIDNNDIVHVVWDQLGTNDLGIYYAQCSPNGIWSPPQRITPPTSYIGSFKLAVGPQGNAHLVWKEGYEPAIFYHAWQRGNDGWSSPQEIARQAHPSKVEGFLIDDNGNLNITWVTLSEGGQRELFYLRGGFGDHWTAPRNIMNDLNDAASYLLVDDWGSVYAIAESSAFDILYTGSIPSPISGDSLLSQQISIPSAMPQPILSFLYQLNGASTTYGTGLSVEISDSMTTTVVFSTAEGAAGWTHAWFDLSPWISETITLTFRVHEEGGFPAAWAILDEVTLGSGYPDVWINSTGVNAALPGETLVYEIAYGNRSALTAEDTIITVTLPSTLTLISASMPPTVTGNTLAWDVGPLSAQSSQSLWITVTLDAAATPYTTFTFPAQISTTNPELEESNNWVNIQTFIGRLVYLPIILRK